MWVPYSYSANVTTLGTSVNSANTRFGGVTCTAWKTISPNESNSTLDAQYEAFCNSGNGSTLLARYEMAGYSVLVYDLDLGNNTSSNQIQEAIWNILDPQGRRARPAIRYTSIRLATWNWQRTGMAT
jgi:hypothetical protein